MAAERAVWNVGAVSICGGELWSERPNGKGALCIINVGSVAMSAMPASH